MPYFPSEALNLLRSSMPHQKACFEKKWNANPIKQTYGPLKCIQYIYIYIAIQEWTTIGRFWVKKPRHPETKQKPPKSDTSVVGRVEGMSGGQRVNLLRQWPGGLIPWHRCEVAITSFFCCLDYYCCRFLSLRYGSLKLFVGLDDVSCAGGSRLARQSSSRRRPRLRLCLQSLKCLARSSCITEGLQGLRYKWLHSIRFSSIISFSKVWFQPLLLHILNPSDWMTILWIYTTGSDMQRLKMMHGSWRGNFRFVCMRSYVEVEVQAYVLGVLYGLSAVFASSAYIDIVSL